MIYEIATDEEVKALHIDKTTKLKDILEVLPIDGGTAYKFVSMYHYLGNALYMSVSSFGTIIKGTNKVVSVASFSRTSNLYSSRSWFNQQDADNFLELSRLCTHPLLNKTNVSSFMLGGAIHWYKAKNNEVFHKTKDVSDLYCRAIITLADSSRHNGTIYRCCNFKYYGLTDYKTDFYSEDGRKNPRCKTFWVHGVWLPRTQKHRYAYILDKSLVCNYLEQPIPSYDKLGLICCKGTKKVYDNRFHEWWSCPICCNKMEKLENAKSSSMV